MTVYLNGEFMAREDAKISVFDRGVMFGDGVYEVTPAYGRQPFRLRQHLERLQRSLAEIRINNPLSMAQWTKGIYMQISRGVAPRDHVFPKDAKPTVFMMCNQLMTPPDSFYEQGAECISAPDTRWLRCQIKSTSLLGNVLARQLAADVGALECIMFRDGFLTEASACNVMVVKDGTVLAPPQDNLILPGITYNVALELMRANKVPLEERKVSEAEVRSADELWLTSTTKELIPVVTLDGKPVGKGAGAGKPGAVFKRMHSLFRALRAKECAPANV
ncbi:MAG: D-amino acid aminotransferase [Proteobacteria bacterium]|nr:D-amino acid aminotransferase [Pseudomonadota bacterium]